MTLKHNQKTFSLRPEVIELLRIVAKDQHRSMSGQLAHLIVKEAGEKGLDRETSVAAN